MHKLLLHAALVVAFMTAIWFWLAGYAQVMDGNTAALTSFSSIIAACIMALIGIVLIVRTVR